MRLHDCHDTTSFGVTTRDLELHFRFILVTNVFLLSRHNENVSYMTTFSYFFCINTVDVVVFGHDINKPYAPKCPSRIFFLTLNVHFILQLFIFLFLNFCEKTIIFLMFLKFFWLFGDIQSDLQKILKKKYIKSF